VLKILISIGLAARTVAAFAPVLDNGFVNFDDGQYVGSNPRVQAGLTRASMARALTTTDACNWHPLTWWSLQLDRELYGPGPRGFHLTNLILHAANVLLLFLTLGRMTGTVWQSAWSRPCLPCTPFTLSPWPGWPSARMCSAPHCRRYHRWPASGPP
jgi:hypothetical protein